MDTEFGLIVPCDTSEYVVKICFDSSCKSLKMNKSDHWKAELSDGCWGRHHIRGVSTPIWRDGGPWPHVREE